ncbi:MAG: DUF748 domain-containing protein [Thermoanaerobaculia bacterium]
MSARRQPKVAGIVQESVASTTRAARRVPRWVLWGGGVLLLLVLLTILTSLFIDEPMRRSMERRMNEKLTGYTVRIPELDFRLLGLSITLENLTVRQDAHPEPAVASIKEWKASVHWKELLSLHLVADMVFDEPSVHINLVQLRSEDRDPVPVDRKGWQQAFAEMYPLKINLLRVRNGEVTYIDEDPRRPIRASRIDFTASNIRNIHARERHYPSPVRLEGVLFDKGYGLFEGHADFLAEPHPGFHTVFSLRDVPLDPLRLPLSRANLIVRGGVLSTSGRIEYASTIKVADVRDLTIRGLRIDYVHTARTAAAEKRRGDKVEKAAEEATNKPGLLLKLRQMRLVNSEVGMVNRAKDPPYRVFVSNLDLQVTNLSNQFREGPAKARLTGRFMGSGKTRAAATFRPEEKGPDFNLDLAIEKTQMTAMNDFLRAYAKVDVVAGVFSLFTELHVKNRAIGGYIKPVFEDLDVYDKRQDKEKSIFKKIYEGVVGGLSKLLESPERDEVVTVAKIEGPVSNPDSSTMEIIARLIQNAFFEAILPGFEAEVGRKRK